MACLEKNDPFQAICTMSNLGKSCKKKKESFQISNYTKTKNRPTHDPQKRIKNRSMNHLYAFFLVHKNSLFWVDLTCYQSEQRTLCDNT